MTEVTKTTTDPIDSAGLRGARAEAEASHASMYLTKFRPTDGRPLTPYEREILTILQEECAEVIAAASKLLRFGADQTNPVTNKLNSDELCTEMGELDHMMDRVAELGLFKPQAFGDGIIRKIDRLLIYLQSEPDSEPCGFRPGFGRGR